MRPLVHIGYHKTGTTWFQRHVFPSSEAGFAYVAGPLLAGPREGRLFPVTSFVGRNPFDFDAEAVRENLGPKIRQAHAQNLVPVISHERLSGSPYGGGFDSRQTADRIAQTFPQARILIVIREQMSMLGSVYKQYVKRGGAESFDQYVTLPSGTGRRPAFQYAFYEYHRLIGYYQRLFGTEDVLALPYELLQEQPDELLGRVSQFLGTPVVTPEATRANISPSALSIALKRQVNRFVVRDGLNPAPFVEIKGANKPLMDFCYSIDERLPASLLEVYENRWRRNLESKVGKRYAKSNAITSKLIGINLQQFGYV